MKKIVIIFGVLTIFLGSCTVNSHLMLKTDKDFVFDEIPEEQSLEYVIDRGDQLDFRLYSNGGFSVIDMASGTGGAGGNAGAMMMRQGMGIFYIVEPSGKVRLPILGEIEITGMTIRSAQDLLEELYAEFYVEPFIQLNIRNKRVIVFPGSGNNAQVVTLNNNAVTLMEVLAQVGGISGDSKARSIKVMRKIDGQEERDVYKIDLSTIDGLKDGNMVVQANDIIYVEPNANIARGVLRDINPIVSLITTSILLYATIRNITN